MELERFEKLIRENERMRTSLVNIQSLAVRALMGAWRQKVYDMASEGLRKPFVVPPATDIASPPPAALRDASPGLPDASRIGGTPGPMQYRVLVALREAPPNGLTESEVALRAGMSRGSVSGCTSGMVNQNGRHWVHQRKHKDGQPWRWHITERGLAALELAH